MIVPTYWAEGRVAERKKGKQVTMRRFGWSDESQEAAQAHADSRVREAFERFQRGETSQRFEYKRGYSGTDGLPIREEIVARHGETIITRNSYGARCLNTPNVLFADIDVETGGFTGWLRETFGSLLGFIAPAMAEDPWAATDRRVREFVTSQTRGRYRLYRTPGGFRVLAMHRTFESTEPAVASIFTSLGVDPIYTIMCTRQRCFRARLSPKPWRIGISKHLGPAHATWPIKPERMAQREQWVDEYEHRARGHAACRFVAEYGDGPVDPAAEAVQRLHDDACQSDRQLPIA